MNKWIIANFKMYKTAEEVDEYCNEIKELVSECREKIVLCPTFVNIDRMVNNLKGTNIFVGAQNCANKSEGAYTGEVSAKMIKSVGANVVVIGHSERRRYYNETDDVIKEKLDNILKENLIPVICLADAGDGDLRETITNQLSVLLKNVTNTNIVLAFEPVWAIGTGKTMEVNDIEETLLLVKTIAKDYLGYMPEVLYGGSVNADNAKEILQLKSVDGVLVGGASKNPYDFSKICKSRGEI